MCAVRAPGCVVAETVLPWPTGGWGERLMGRCLSGRGRVHSGGGPRHRCPLGLDHFLYGLTDEMGQAQREQLFAVHRGVLIDVAHR